MPRYEEARAVVARGERRRVMFLARKLLSGRPLLPGELQAGDDYRRYLLFVTLPWARLQVIATPEALYPGGRPEAHLSVLALRPVLDAGGRPVLVDGVTAVEQSVPTWHELVILRALVWGDEQEVRQILPAQSDYVNMHPAVMHLWGPLPGGVPRAQGGQHG